MLDTAFLPPAPTDQDPALLLLEPSALWARFREISRAPRASGKEQHILEYVKAWAQHHGFALQQDSAGNVVIRTPASQGREAESPTVLQAHLDMVCEKNDSTEHDFDRDPLHLILEGDWVAARGTTLGADNGIGVAAALAVAEDPKLDHGPLELLFTIDEERGLNGVQGLAQGLLQGRRMLNLDTEEDGAVYVGCAGGGDVQAFLPIESEDRPEGWSAVVIDLRGCTGGHSGLDIHLGRMNAIRALARILERLLRAEPSLRILRFDGGSKRNAIPREASAALCVPPSLLPQLQGVLLPMESELRAEHGETDPDFKLLITERPSCACSRVFSPAFTRRLLAAVLATPSSVLAMDRSVPGLVDTSNNLGVLRSVRPGDKDFDSTDPGGHVELLNGTRSSMLSALNAQRQALRALYELAGARVITKDAYAGWKPNLASPLLKSALGIHQELFGQEARVKAVHAGLECGLIGERYPGMDMISIGPEIHGAHSPSERVHVPSVDKFWRFLVETLRRLT